MNAKKSKALRKQAKQIALDNNLPKVEYGFTQYQKGYVDLLGKPHTYTVYTCYMKTSERLVYQQLKKNSSVKA